MSWLDKLTAWLYYRQPERPVREPIDYGDGLRRLPDPDPESGKTFDTTTDSWITFEEAAREAQISIAPYLHQMD
jgi:hypothetical protein